MDAHPTTELAVLLTIARVDLGLCESARLRELLAEKIDWALLLALADRHGLVSLLFHHVRQDATDLVPAESMDDLRGRSKDIAQRTLILASHLQRIAKHFFARQIEHIWYKGPLLAEMYYGNCALRESRDLDIIVPRSKLADARDALVELGFSDKYGLRNGQQAVSFRVGFEHPFTAPGGIDVDLHCRVVQRFKARSLDMDGIWRRVTKVNFFSREATTFCPEDLLVALCLHAGHHGWMQLSHLCDLAQLLNVHSELDWEIVRSHLGDSNTRRIVDLSLYLLHRHWPVQIPGDILEKVVADPNVIRLAVRIEAEIWPVVDPKLTTSSLSWMLERSTGEKVLDRVYLLAGSFLFPAIEDFEQFRLPAFLTPLYPGLRFLRLARNFTQSLWQT